MFFKKTCVKCYHSCHWNSLKKDLSCLMLYLVKWYVSLKAVFNKFNQFEQYKHDCIQSLFALGNKSDINLKVDIDENENEFIENEIWNFMDDEQIKYKCMIGYNG